MENSNPKNKYNEDTVHVCSMPKFITNKYGIMMYLSNVQKRYSNFMDRTIIFDFTYTRWIQKEMLAVLGLIFTKIKSKRNKVYLRGLSRKQKELLIEFNFINNGVNFKEKLKGSIVYNSFNGDDVNRFRTYLQNEMKYVESIEISKFILTHIMEIFLNIKTHARGKNKKSKFANKEVFSSGYFDKHKHELVISICNNGRTFYKNILERACIEYDMEWMYIKWALGASNTTTTGRPGGGGLAMVKELIVENKGELIICSGKAYYSIRFDQDGHEFNEKIELETDLPATIVIVKIHTDKIQGVCVNEDEEYTIDKLFSC